MKVAFFILLILGLAAFLILAKLAGFWIAIAVLGLSIITAAWFVWALLLIIKTTQHVGTADEVKP